MPLGSVAMFGVGIYDRKLAEIGEIRDAGIMFPGNGVRHGMPVGPVTVVFGSKISPE